MQDKLKKDVEFLKNIIYDFQVLVMHACRLFGTIDASISEQTGKQRLALRYLQVNEEARQIEKQELVVSAEHLRRVLTEIAVSLKVCGFCECCIRLFARQRIAMLHGLGRPNVYSLPFSKLEESDDATEACKSHHGGVLQSLKSTKQLAIVLRDRIALPLPSPPLHWSPSSSTASSEPPSSLSSVNEELLRELARLKDENGALVNDALKMVRRVCNATPCECVHYARILVTKIP